MFSIHRSPLGISLLATLCCFTFASGNPETETLTASAAKRLNNLVNEIISHDFSTAGAQAVKRISFELKEQAWVHIEAERTKGQTDTVTLHLNSESAPVLTLDTSTGSPDTMRLLPAGRHVLEIHGGNKEASPLRLLTVRTIPQLIFYGIDEAWYQRAQFDYAISRTYDELVASGILSNFNIVCSDAYEDTDAYVDQIEKWRSLGRRWVAKVGIAYDAAELESKWAKPMADPRIDGVMADEFSVKRKEHFPFWVKAINDLSQRPELKEKTFYAFSGFTHSEDTYLPLTKAVSAAGFFMAPEVYCRTEARQLQTPADMMRWREALPGVEKNFVYILGPNNATNGMTFHLQPEVDFKVLLEKQVAMIANDPAFSDLAGVGIWASRYMDEDVLRWYSHLVRHYFIEGKTTLLGSDQINLTHLENPGFEKGEQGWTIKRASDQSLAVKPSSLAPYIKRAYSAVPEGKKVLYTKRSAESPNEITQTIKGLTPGRVYHLNVYTQDINNSAKSPAISIGIDIKGAEVLKENALEKMIVAPAKAGRPKAKDQEDTNTFEVDLGDIESAWQHSRRLFRATAPTAELTLSDWPSSKGPGENVGQELIWDFITIAPDVSLEPVLSAAK